ncbi:kanadaptin [Abrus precatorius]|uniref:Kanadaptin n=1 Tax=Abrus precatorius TaxID=3816 RepID=A0A8B8L7L0_ABRPR|nr:kanadaptin [Abrus precatorius]
MTKSMGPPPPKNPNLPETAPSMPPPRDSEEAQPPPPRDSPKTSPSQGVAAPYKIPPWSSAPSHQFYLEVLKDGSIIDKFDVCEKGAYMFGRLDLCDFVLEHPTISRFHAVIQFKRSGDAYLYDLGSTHGTFLNKNQVEKNTYVDLHVGDVIRFGRSSRMFIFQGPSELMPPETNKKLLREVKMQEAMLDREASLRRARLEASHAEGISWGMGEDAIEEDEDDADEVTWQSYKGPLTEKQEKTREKIIKRMEKIANMKKEINSIRVKDISQGGLTQGQQTQIARNEQRITQILEELENLEETLNDSIRESIGARTGKISHGKKKGEVEDEEEYYSDDDDEFYDRTKRKPSHQKPGDNQSIETADTLLDKRDAIIKEMDEKKELLVIEKNKMLSGSESATQDEVGDSLDAYMSGLSSQLVYDKSVQLEKDLSTLQSELDRICYLLKIADPTGEAAKKRELKVLEPKPKKSEAVTTPIKKKAPAEAQKSSETCAKADYKIPPVETQKIGETCVKAEGSTGEKAATATLGLDKSEPGSDKLEDENVVFTVPKPQWLGAVEDRVTEDNTLQLMPPLHLHETDESNQFVDYKDRNKFLGSGGDAKTSVESKIESAAPGLIIRKRKQVETTGTNSNDASQQVASSTSGEQMAEDAVALLLKHQRGLFANDDEERYEGQERKGPKRVLGPEKPSFLNNEMDYDSWVPPEGQSGDGRTSLNDRYGY